MAKQDEAAALSATDLQDILKEGKKRPLNFALLKTKEGVVIKTHYQKSADVMFREGKQAGGLPAVSVTGVLTVVGKKIEMKVGTDDVPKMLPKLAKRHFKALGVKCKVAMILPSGERVEDGEDDDEDGDEPLVKVDDGLFAAEEDPDGQAEAALTARIDAARPRVQAALDAGSPGADQMMVNLDAAAAEVKSGDLQAAEQTIKAVETALDQRAQSVRPVDPAALRATLLAEFGKLGEGLEAIRTQAAAAVAKKGQALADMFRAELDRDPKKAGTVVSMLAGFVKAEAGKLDAAPAASSAAPAEPSAPGGPAAGPAAAPHTGTPSPAAGEVQVPPTLKALYDGLASTFGAVWTAIQDGIESRKDAVAGRMREQEAITRQRDAIAAIYNSGPMDAAMLAKLAPEIIKLNGMITQAKKITDLESRTPEAAASARTAMEGFDEKLGEGTQVTPELLAQIATEKANAEGQKAAAQAKLDAAAAMPEGKAKKRAQKAALDEIIGATVALETAQGREKAAKGKQYLIEAISTGPLAADTATPFSDASTKEFIEAFAREPELAKFGVETAAGSENPDAIAGGMDMLADKMRDGFADKNGNKPPAGFNGEGYAKNLIKGAGAEGGAYMAGAGEYIKNGQHMVPSPIPSPNGGSVKGRERDRSNYMADAVMQPDGTIKPQSDKAKTAQGHLRFNPDVINQPTPSLNNHVNRMMDTFSVPANQMHGKAVLDSIGTPTGTGQQLVARGQGKAAGSVTADDAKRQVMASMMSPVHQGDVGSCFATAGVKRMNELDPMQSMGRYAELAKTGVFRPRDGGDPIPAVMNFSPDEDPLIRSMEYSAATSMVSKAGNWRGDYLEKQALPKAVDGLADAVGDSFELVSRMGWDNWEADEKLIRATLVDSFSVEYDATRSTAKSADGSSSKGVYVLMQLKPTKTPIDSKAAFVTAMTERVLTGIGEPKDSEKGKEIAKVIASEDYLKTLMKDDNIAPWSLGGGGSPSEADDILFGGGQKIDMLTSAKTKGERDAGQTEGQRSEKVLASILKAGQGVKDKQFPISNLSIHAFNALPQDPSLQPLMHGDVDKNIEEKLTKPGKAAAGIPLSDDKAKEIARETAEQLKSWDPSRRPMIEAALGRGVPGGKTPKETKAAIMKALEAYMEALFINQTDIWKNQEIAAGRAVTPAQYDAKKAELAKQFTDAIESKIMTSLVKEVPLPKFKFANSNWGNAESDTDLLMMPDPVTGETKMWKKHKPSGVIEPIEEKWVDDNWGKIGPK